MCQKLNFMCKEPHQCGKLGVGESFLKLLSSLGLSGLSRWGLVNGQIRDTVKFLLFLSGMQSSLYYYVNIIT